MPDPMTAETLAKILRAIEELRQEVAELRRTIRGDLSASVKSDRKSPRLKP